MVAGAFGPSGNNAGNANGAGVNGGNVNGGSTGPA